MPAEKVTVATPRQEVLAHMGRIQTVTDLMGGQQAMRAAGERYIARGKDEPKGKWEARVNGATLLNAYERTLAYLAGQVFSKDVQLGEEGEDTDTTWEEWADNCDGQGNNLTVAAKRMFGHGLNDGYVLVLVDSAAIQTRETPAGRQYLAGKDEAGQQVWSPLTAADADALGLRPRLIEVRAENVLGWRYEITGSRTRLVLLRLLETYQVPAEWDAGDETRQQVRVLRPGMWQVWRKVVEDKDEWFLFEEGALPGQEIPVAIFRPGKPLDEMTAAPALEALADKNIEHWQKAAKHNWMMQWVRSPGMYVTGAMPEDEVPWGPDTLTKISDPQGKIVPVGVDASSVAASMAELKDIEAQMALFGLQMLMPRTGDVTATEKALSSAESDSTLAGWAGEFKDALEMAVSFVAEFMGMDGDSAPGVEVNTEFHALAAFDDQTLTALITAATNGKLPVEVLWSEMRRRGIIAEEWTPDRLQEALRQQNLDGTFAAAAGAFLQVPTPGQGPSNAGSPASGGSQAGQQQSDA